MSTKRFDDPITKKMLNHIAFCFLLLFFTQICCTVIKATIDIEKSQVINQTTATTKTITPKDTTPATTFVKQTSEITVGVKPTTNNKPGNEPATVHQEPVINHEKNLSLSPPRISSKQLLSF